MKIGIIGAGNIGSTLTRRLTTHGHTVRVANSREPETLAELTAATGATAVRASEAAQGAEVVIVTIPERSIPLLPPRSFDDAADGAVIIDTGNYYPERDGRIEPIEAGATESRWVSNELGRPVVKAFNNIRAQDLLDRGLPRGTPGRIALPVAGDDEQAKSIVMNLVDELGFDAIDAGTLDGSWRQQPGTPAYGTNLDAEGLRSALLTANPEREPAWRA
jgi:predicted dinucleotide-binding enzyme